MTGIALQKKSDVPAGVQKQADAADAAMEKLVEGKPVVIDEPNPEPEKPQAPPVKEVPKDEGTWKHKYDVLDGMFRKKIGEKDELINQLTATVQNLNALLMKKVEAEKPEDQPKIEQLSSKRLDPDDYEGYGPEMVDMVEMVNALGDQNKSLKTENDQLKGRVEEVGSTVEREAESKKEEAKERYVNDLTNRVQDWRSVNQDAQWLEWLDQPDSVSGIRRQTLLDDASAKLDVNRTAVFFNNFKNEAGWKTPTADNAPENGKESQVVPEVSSSSSDVIGEEKKITPAQFQKASKDFTQGRIKAEQYQKISNNFQRSLAK